MLTVDLCTLGGHIKRSDVDASAFLEFEKILDTALAHVGAVDLGTKVVDLSSSEKKNEEGFDDGPPGDTRVGAFSGFF